MTFIEISIPINNNRRSDLKLLNSRVKFPKGQYLNITHNHDIDNIRWKLQIKVILWGVENGKNERDEVPLTLVMRLPTQTSFFELGVSSRETRREKTITWVTLRYVKEMLRGGDRPSRRLPPPVGVSDCHCSLNHRS